MKKRILTLLLAALMLMQLAVPAGAEEPVEYPRTRVGKIRIYTTATEQTAFPAALQEENEQEYTILLTPGDIAAITGVTLEKEGDTYRFLRGGYEVRVSAYSETASILIHIAQDPVSYRVYSRLFDLPEMEEVTDDYGRTALYLPLEKMLYLLNATWYVDSKTVFVFPTGDNMWDILVDWADQYLSALRYSDVVGETVGEIWGNAFKYGLQSVADELDARILFNGYGFAVSKMEEALLELSTSAVSRFTGSEADPLNQLMESLNPPFGEMLGRMGKLYEFAENIPVEEIDTAIPAVLNRVCGSLTEWTPGKVATDMGTWLNTMNYLAAAWEAVQVVNRSGSWSQGYVEQLAHLKDIREEDFQNMGLNADSLKDVVSKIRTAAASLHSEYGNAFMTGVYEGVKQGLLTTADLFLQFSGQPAYLVKEAYDAGVAVARTVIPDIDRALKDADNYQKTKCHFDVTSLVSGQYVDALNRLLMGGPTKTELKEARMLGTLMTNASAHGYYNLYLAEGESSFLEKARKNSGYTLRLDNSAQYDARLILDEEFRNLYSSANGAVREQIPREYVIFPADQVVVTVRYITGGGPGYTWSVPEITVHIPENREMEEIINASSQLTELVPESEADFAWLAEMAEDQEGLFENREVESVFATPGILIIRVRAYMYTGGAHPIHGVTTCSFDLLTGQPLTLAGILSQGNEDAAASLQARIEDQLTKLYEGSFFGADSIRSAAQAALKDEASWELNREGLTIQYAPGTVASYGAGYITVTIPYGQLEGILDEAYMPVYKEAEGAVELCSLGAPMLEKMQARFGRKTEQALAVLGRANEVTVLADGQIAGYANYLTNGLIWLPDAQEYVYTANGEGEITLPGPLAE